MDVDESVAGGEGVAVSIQRYGWFYEGFQVLKPSDDGDWVKYDDHIKSLEDAPKWNLVSEGLQPINCLVLCHDKDGFIHLGYFANTDEGWLDCYHEEIFPTHWRELPPAPEVEAEEVGR